MADQSMLDNSCLPTAAAVEMPTNPYEIALQSLCKQLLKSRLFRGFYIERRYVDSIKGYRDIVSLQKSERSLEKMLRDIRDKLQLFYSQQNPQMWIGITSGAISGINLPPAGALQTYLWVEMNDIAFGQYWFSIKNIRFRDNEIILKLKEVRSVEEETTPRWTPVTATTKAICDKADSSLQSSIVSSQTFEKQVDFEDYILLLQQWWVIIKQTVYNFMAQDINKENFKSCLRFVGLLIVSLASAAVVGIKYVGVFTLRFMFELSRLTHVLTPIIFKIIEVVSKMIGGFYILLAMIWKDAVVNRNQPKHNAVGYNSPMYKSIQYEIRNRKLESSASPTSFGKSFQ